MKGFKLGHFKNPNEGYLKAIVWNETQAMVYAFNKDPYLSEDSRCSAYKGKQIKFKGDIEIKGKIKRILDFGI